MDRRQFPALIELLTQYAHGYYNALNDKEVEELESVMDTMKKIAAEK